MEWPLLRVLRSRAGNFISEEELCRTLGITQERLRQLVKSLKARGFLIKFDPSRGYRIAEVDDLGDTTTILEDLDTRLCFTLLYFDEVSSTQDVAKGLPVSVRREGLVVIAERQSRGRGRFGRKWFSEPGGLWLTVVLKPTVSACRLGVLSLMSGLVIAKSIRDITGLQAQVKWPNDVLIGGRKVAGVLIEATVESDLVTEAFVGIGINVNNEVPEELRHEVITLKEAMCSSIPRVWLLRALLRNLDHYYEAFQGGRYISVVDEWKAYSCTLNRRVTAILPTGSIEGTAVDVDDYGRLILLTKAGLVRVDVYEVIHLR